MYTRKLQVKINTVAYQAFFFFVKINLYNFSCTKQSLPEHCLDTTKIEEHVVCKLKPKRYMKEVTTNKLSGQSTEEETDTIHSQFVYEVACAKNSLSNQSSHKKSHAKLQNETKDSIFLSNDTSTNERDRTKKDINALSSELPLLKNQQSKKSTSESVPTHQKGNKGNKGKITQNLITYDAKDTSFEFSSDGLSVWVPKFNPPAKAVIQDCMHIYDIPNVRYQQPYYSDASHVTGAVEIGHSILKIQSKLSTHLPEFTSAFSSSLETTNFNVIKMYEADATESDRVDSDLALKYPICIVTPVKLPPTSKNIYEYQTQCMENKAVIKDKKTKIRLPASPENDMSDQSLSISYSLNDMSTESEPIKSNLPFTGNKNR